MRYEKIEVRPLTPYVGDLDWKLHESLGRFSRQRGHADFASTRAELADALAVSAAG
jgi:hypothetical protein